jgi:hypothetical protein
MHAGKEKAHQAASQDTLVKSHFDAAIDEFFFVSVFCVDNEVG